MTVICDRSKQVENLNLGELIVVNKNSTKRLVPLGVQEHTMLLIATIATRCRYNNVHNFKRQL